MADFMIHFLFCNVLICLIIGILLGVKRLSRPLLTSRMQYTIWFLLFGCLAAPFLPARSARFLPHFSWFENVSDVSSDSLAYASRNIAGAQAVSANWMNDLSVSVMEHSSPAIGSVLSAVWIAGVLFMLFFTVRSRICLHALQKNAQPLDGVCKTIHGIYLDCLAEMNLKKPVPIYAVDRLASPIMTGLFRPRIYVPLHLVSGFSSSEIRYILLHELQHYRCKDALVNDLMAAAGIVYWFNPLLWYAWKLIRTDREIACDSSVLKMLEEDAYIEYGNTLIHFAEKISFTPFLFSSGIGGNAVQIKKRILNIAGYRPAAVGRRLTGFLACVLTAALLAGFLPALTSKAADSESYTYEDGGRNVSALDLSETFGSYNGSFVLYDAGRTPGRFIMKRRRPPAYLRRPPTRSTAPCTAFRPGSYPGKIPGFPGIDRTTITIPGIRIRLWNLPWRILSPGISRRSTADWAFPPFRTMSGRLAMEMKQWGTTLPITGTILP